MAQKSFIVVIGDDILRSSRIYGILQSYSILNAHMIYSNDLPCITKDIGTIVHIESREKIQSVMYSVPSTVRYIGLVNGTDEIMCPSNATGYVAIPVPPTECLLPPTMYAVQYPHVTLAPPMEVVKLNQFKSLLGCEIEYKWSDPVQTKSVVAHPVLIKGEIHHVTRGVVHGQFPKRAAIEMDGIQADLYEISVGFPVIM